MKTSKPRQLSRRLVLKSLGLLGGLFAVRQVAASHTETHFDDVAKHRIIYQCNKADPEYLQHILFSVGELLRKYGDDVEIVVGVFGPGLHLVGKVPGRPVPDNLQASAASLAAYGVAFHACGNTMKSLGWTEKELLPFARVVPIGVDDIMLLQEQGFAYMSW
ncbi:MAG: DsrE family protein [Gammaproteobacteria bacterium]|nr:DsrE family protein [Gammaproteobacteria bacterium]